MKTAKRRIIAGLPAAVFCVLAMMAGTGPAIGQTDKTEQKERHEDAMIEHARKPWKGDLDGMVKRGFIRVLTTYNPLFYRFDRAKARGVVAVFSHEFEKRLRKKLGKPARHLNVIVILASRDEIIPRLRSGRGDIVAANLTITPARQKLVDFSTPFFPDVSELVVTGPAGKKIGTFDDLVKTGVHIRRSSSYFEHLTHLNKQRKKAGKKAIPIEAADERLEDYDLLEMVNAGVIPAVIVDSHKAKLWAKAYKKIKIHKDLAVNTGGDIAWAVRKGSPKLLAAVNGFNKVARKGTMLGNILTKRYLKTPPIDDNTSSKARAKFEAIAGFIKKYATQYDFDWLMIAAQGYQESKLDQKTKSRAGAVGVMQLLPTTAADPKVAITDIHKAEQNIHAGVKYLRLLRDSYFSDKAIKPIDRVFFSFAAYNAGPGNIAKARRRAKRMGLDPNRWFDHTEIAAARAISREPVIYVRNIFKYFVTYKRLVVALNARDAAKEKTKK